MRLPPSRAASVPRFQLSWVWSTVHGLAMLKLEQRLPPNARLDDAIRDISQMTIAGMKADSHDI
jgi:hypothetical protein